MTEIARKNRAGPRSPLDPAAISISYRAIGERGCGCTARPHNCPMETPISHRQASGRVVVTPERSPHAMARTPEETRAAGGTLRSALATVVAASAVPYGYTLAIWGSGAVLLRSLGAPTAAEAFIFAAGAIAGFYLVSLLPRLVASVTPGPANPINRYEDRVLAGAFDWIAVGAALGAVSLLDGIHGWLAWLVGPFAATVIYLLIASAQLTVVVLREK
jgi:hypothetical protein